MITLAELEQLLDLGHETRSFEVKGPGSRKAKAYCAIVARAVMAMGNLRDGGLVCLGINEAAISEKLPGLGEYLSEWADFDDVSDALARFSDPPVELHVEVFRLSSGVEVVVLQVAEFRDVPHLCKRSHLDVLRAGQVYVRPRGKPASVPVPSAIEMRELVDVATDKGVREFVRRMDAAGIRVGPEVGRSPSTTDRFDAEQAAAWDQVSPPLARLLSLGHIDVAVRPVPFEPDRLTSDQLEPFIVGHAVRLRGWPLPFVDSKQQVARHGTWIGQDVDAEVVPHLEAWRMCASGQFLHRRALATDMRDSAQLEPTIEGATGTVAVWDVLLYMVELAEFGARLATALGCEAIVFELRLGEIEGRQLISGVWEREIDDRYVFAGESLSGSMNVRSASLIASTREAGVSLAQEVLRKFRLALTDQVLMDWQQEVFDRRS